MRGNINKLVRGKTTITNGGNMMSRRMTIEIKQSTSLVILCLCISALFMGCYSSSNVPICREFEILHDAKFGETPTSLYGLWIAKKNSDSIISIELKGNTIAVSRQAGPILIFDTPYTVKEVIEATTEHHTDTSTIEANQEYLKFRHPNPTAGPILSSNFAKFKIKNNTLLLIYDSWPTKECSAEEFDSVMFVRK